MKRFTAHCAPRIGATAESAAPWVVARQVPHRPRRPRFQLSSHSCRKTLLLLLACGLAGAGDAIAACEQPVAWSGLNPSVGFRIDNDALTGDDEDRGYSNGLQLTLRTGNLQGLAEPDCLPFSVRTVNRVVDWLYPAGLDQKNVLFNVFHGVFTPADHTATDVIVDDRPYAAVLLFGAGYNARRSDTTLHTTQLRFGIVGPSAKGKQLQNGIHHVLGVNQYRGWNNQVRDEPVLQLLHERLRRVEFSSVPWGFESDLIGHWGGSLGNYATHANAGFEWRFGRNLSTDFGTDPLRPETENVARGDAPAQRWAWNAFVSVDVRAVAHNITLDGNTWKDSHGVAKKRWVADLGYGVALVHRSWKLVLSQYYRTREFEGQPHRSVFGSLTLVREL
jgi:lipid A 3-O-deacylase